MVDADDEQEALYAQAAEQAQDDAMQELSAVMELLQSQLADASVSEAAGEMSAAGRVIADLADEHGNASDMLENVDLHASEIAKNTGFTGGADRILGAVEPPIKEVERDQADAEIEEQLDNGEREYTLDRGVGLDEYVEDRLERVAVIDTRDHMSDKSFVFEFDDGTAVEFEDTDHRNLEKFAESISTAAPVQVRGQFASNQAREDITGDVTEDEWAAEKYRELSHGPEERPWGLDWDEVISHLDTVEAEAMDEPPLGVNSSAWADIKSSLTSDRARAAHDKQSVVDAADGAVHYNESLDEIWVPNQIINTACEENNTDPGSLVFELDKRGVTSDEIAGKSAVKPDNSTHPAQRWWCFDASHPDVPTPIEDLTIVEEIDDERNTFATDAGTGAVADGGSTKYGGEE